MAKEPTAAKKERIRQAGVDLAKDAKKIYDDFKHLCSDPETPPEVRATLKALKSIADYKPGEENA